MLVTYNLKENEWLKRMFAIKEKWALVYGRQTFCADMSSTQRSESMNSVVKRYVSYKHDLLPFFEHFQRLVNDRRFEEAKVDYIASQTTPMMSFHVQTLKHAASVYTPAVFEAFEKKLCKAHDCSMEVECEADPEFEYKITSFGRKHHHLVKYDSFKGTILCTCKKFEFVGILCAHCLKGLTLKNIVKIHSHYILKRWKKSAKSGNVECVSEIVNDKEDPKTNMRQIYKELCTIFRQLSIKGAENDDAHNVARYGGIDLLKRVDATLENGKTQEPRIKHSNEVRHEIDVEHEKGGTSKATEMKIKGIKIKEKPANKYGKRIQGGIDRKRKKKKVSKNVGERDNCTSSSTSIADYQLIQFSGSQDSQHNPQIQNVAFDSHTCSVQHPYFLQVQTPNPGNFMELLLRQAPQPAQMTKLQAPQPAQMTQLQATQPAQMTQLLTPSQIDTRPP